MREHRIRANGLTHYVRDSGEETAPAALLLHGFPDSADVWTPITPALIEAGYRIVAPDMRGFGRTDMAARVDDYLIRPGVVADMIAILDALRINSAHVVGHDFGAPVAWALAADHAERFRTLTAISVGHPRAYLSAGIRQKLMSWYIVMHQLRGLCEWLYRRDDWALLRNRWSKHGDIEEAIALLSRPGRLTAGLNWYRANFSLKGVAELYRDSGGPGDNVRIPTMGIWSDGDKYLAEDQMPGSAKFVAAPWRYERIEGASHWISYDAPARLAALLASHWRAHETGR
jgi:pimeloyl-ACP methyl ester carboxylesterase